MSTPWLTELENILKCSENRQEQTFQSRGTGVNHRGPVSAHVTYTPVSSLSCQLYSALCSTNKTHWNFDWNCYFLLWVKNDLTLQNNSRQKGTSNWEKDWVAFVLSCSTYFFKKMDKIVSKILKLWKHSHKMLVDSNGYLEGSLDFI